MISPRSRRILITGKQPLGRLVDKCHSSLENYNQVIILFMRGSHYPSLKTVNIDSDIFTQQSPPARSKLPLHLLKSLAQRKRSKHNCTFLGERYQFHMGRNRMSVANQESQTTLNETTHSRAIDLFTRIKHAKSKPQHTKNRPISLTDYNFAQKNSNSHSRNDQQFQQFDPRQQKECFPERQQQSISQHLLQYQYTRQNSTKINPYTQQQYTYLTNKEHDQLYQIKKATRFRRISSITKSYKVATIELAPQMHQRKPSIQYSPTKNSHSPTKQLSKQKKPMPKKKEVQGSPTPWDWGGQQSKDYLQ